MLKLLNKFILIFEHDQEGLLDMETRMNYLLCSLINFFLFSVVLIGGIMSIIKDSLFTASILLLLSIISAILFVYPQQKLASKYYKDFLTITIIVTDLFFVIFGSPSLMNIFWAIVFPFVSINIFPVKKGLTYALIMLLILEIIFWLIPGDMIIYSVNYTLNMKLLYNLLYFISIIFAYTLRFMYLEIILAKEKETIRNENNKTSRILTISSLSRQIRTPLNNIIGALDMIDTETFNEDQKDYINIIQASTNNITSVVNGLTNKSIKEIDNNDTIVTFNLYSTIKNILQLFSEDKNKKNKFSLSFSADIPSTLVGNVILIKQILLNILSRLIEANKSNENDINIKVIRTSNSLKSINLKFIIDSTNNITSSHNNDNNNLNNNTESINNKRNIDFLDLELTDKLIEKKENKLLIENNNNKLRITFGISFALGNINNLNQNNTNQKLNNKVGKELENVNVLLAENNFSNQQIIIFYLKNKVNKINIVNNGKEAVEHLSKSKCDIILMDIQMPVMDGFKATQKIRAIENGTGTHTPIIAVTANAFYEDKEKCLSAGMDDYISKPFQPEELINIIKKHI